MNFPSLHSLNLSNNALLALSPGIFSNLGALHMLDLSSCSITYLHKDTFKGLGNLHTLILRNNSLQELEVPFFLPLKSLFHLDLQHNALVSADTWSLQLLDAVPWVQLEGNPWVCNCTVYPLQQWLQRRQGEWTGQVAGDLSGRRNSGCRVPIQSLCQPLGRLQHGFPGTPPTLLRNSKLQSDVSCLLLAITDNTKEFKEWWQGNLATLLEKGIHLYVSTWSVHVFKSC